MNNPGPDISIIVDPDTSLRDELKSEKKTPFSLQYAVGITMVRYPFRRSILRYHFRRPIVETIQQAQIKRPAEKTILTPR